VPAEPALTYEPEPPDPAAYRQALGRFPTGVTVATTVLDGVDHAMTASAFTSVSLEPLLVLLSVGRDTRFHDAILSSGRWAVSVLGEAHREVAVWLATKGRPLLGQLDRVPFTRGPFTGAAVIEGALATVEAQTYAVYDGGDHSLVVGSVLAVDVPSTGYSADGWPLLYYRGDYRSLRRVNP